MATLMLMHWSEASKDQYLQARKEIDWEGNVPTGAKFHVAWVEDDGLHVLDLWESKEDFEKFTKDRLMPGVQKIGIQGQPKVTFMEPITVFAPNV
jgi:hypothetical protein